MFKKLATPLIPPQKNCPFPSFKRKKFSIEAYTEFHSYVAVATGKADMELSQDVAVTSSSLVDNRVADNAKAGEPSSDDNAEAWLTDCDEEADEAFYLNREGKRRREEFYTAGYRDGVTAGKNDAAQDGFNLGFKDSVMVGHKWGIMRGVTSALAHIPNELKLKIVETEDKRKQFLDLHEAVDSIGTEDALKLFYEDIQRGALTGRNKPIDSIDSSIFCASSSEHSGLESYFEKLDLLLKETPVLDVQPDLNKNRVS